MTVASKERLWLRQTNSRESPLQRVQLSWSLTTTTSAPHVDISGPLSRLYGAFVQQDPQSVQDGLESAVSGGHG